MMQPDLDFEREKWLADVELKRRELSLRERQQDEASTAAKTELELKRREQDNRDLEAKLKKGEYEGRGWKNPLVLAIIATAVAATGNAAVSVVNGYFQRDLEDRKSSAELALERSKSESTRIVEMIKTGDPERAAKNLEFLLNSGLLADPALTAKLAEFLKQRSPGAGPVLPVGVAEYLDKLGFAQGPKGVVINVSKTGPLNAYYSSGTINIHPALIGDASVALREYAHHVLNSGLTAQWAGQFAAIESGVADYLACSYLNDAKLGEKAAKVFKMDKPFIRNLQNQHSFAEMKNVQETNMPYEGAEIWGGALWDVRARLGREVADGAIASAWRSTSWPQRTDSVESADRFVRALMTAAEAKGAASAKVVRTVLLARSFIHQP